MRFSHLGPQVLLSLYIQDCCPYIYYICLYNILIYMCVYIIYTMTQEMRFWEIMGKIRSPLWGFFAPRADTIKVTGKPRRGEVFANISSIVLPRASCPNHHYGVPSGPVQDSGKNLPPQIPLFHLIMLICMANQGKATVRKP